MTRTFDRPEPKPTLTFSDLPHAALQEVSNLSKPGAYKSTSTQALLPNVEIFGNIVSAIGKTIADSARLGAGAASAIPEAPPPKAIEPKPQPDVAATTDAAEKRAVTDSSNKYDTMLTFLKDGKLDDFAKALTKLSATDRQAILDRLNVEFQDRGIRFKLHGGNGLEIQRDLGANYRNSESIFYELTNGALKGGTKSVDGRSESMPSDHGFKGLREIAADIRSGLRDRSRPGDPVALLKDGWLEELRDDCRGKSLTQVNDIAKKINDGIKGSGVTFSYSSRENAFQIEYNDGPPGRTRKTVFQIPLSDVPFSSTTTVEGPGGYSYSETPAMARMFLDQKLKATFK